MLVNDPSNYTVRISNDKMSFDFSYADGLRIESIIHENSKLNWLEQTTEAFELTVRGRKIPASAFTVDQVQAVNDGAQEYAIFDLSVEKPYRFTARVSAYTAPDSSIILLAQLGTDWENEWPEEIFMHIPLFGNFGDKNNQWYLSSCPVKRPDGVSVMQLHDSFDMPICNISADRKTGFSMELRDTNLYAAAWNQLRNCDLLHMTDQEQLKNNKILLRLENKALADVYEFRFFALDEGWSEAFLGWKKRIVEQMDLSEYDREDLLWYKKVLFQHFTYAYSREVFDYETEQFDPERLIEDGMEFGGYDSVLLWYQYPRLGVDKRNQWDFNFDIPGGIAGMRDFTRRCHAKNVKVFLPYKPWDVTPEEDTPSILDHIAEVISGTEIDGIWFDTMDSVPAGFRERIDSIRPGVLFCTEVHPALGKTIETITGHWDQFMDPVIMPNSYILRYLFPENNAPITSRWKIGESKDTLINRAIFNATGIAVWQDIFGAWLPFSTDQKAKLKKWKGILLENFDTFFGKDPVPMVPVEQDSLYANRFISDDRKNIIYTIYNASDKPVEGALIRVENETGKEIWHNSFVKTEGSILKGRIDSKDILVVTLSV